MSSNKKVYEVQVGLRHRLLALAQIGAVLFGVVMLFYCLLNVIPAQQ